MCYIPKRMFCLDIRISLLEELVQMSRFWANNCLNFGLFFKQSYCMASDDLEHRVRVVNHVYGTYLVIFFILELKNQLFLFLLQQKVSHTGLKCHKAKYIFMLVNCSYNTSAMSENAQILKHRHVNYSLILERGKSYLIGRVALSR